ncbi:CAP domain-containing protein [Flavobacterium aquariorum]|uniref:CAP domain-containing protein n=1 Tax=Flavobacterium aquariorum TaxID=2217670 RepID=A0A2W7TRN2_9FLAO|nr:CAP domain-containing protein [Flavobacterium aquariorum]PZX93213.1 CAP domain-containing protein [Flavobacterium aquariorum]
MNSKLFRLCFFAAILSFIVSCTAEDSATTQEASENPAIVLNYDYSPVELETMTLINNYRVSIGLNALEKINHVSYKSEEHDNYMIANNVVNHDDFEARSSNIMKVLHAKNVSENIAYNYNSAKGAFDAWLKSEGHKQNIEGDFTHFGISIRENPANGKKYYTNIFVKI